MGNKVTLTINDEKKVTKVEGGNIEKHDGPSTTVEVAQTENLLAGNCPAWIKIGGTWYKI
jgi:hypothetical protein